MNDKPRIHYHSDCRFFAGCENMVANLLNARRLQDAFNISFSFRNSKRYRAGLKVRIPTLPPTRALHLGCDAGLLEWVSVLPNLLATPIRLLSYVFLLKYFILLWNVAVLYNAWRTERIDILHINNGGYPGASSCRAAAIAGRMCRIPHILMVVNNIAARPTRLAGWIEVPIGRLMASSVTLFLTGSLVAAEALKRVLGLPPAQTLNLYNGISARIPTETAVETRNRLGIGMDDLAIGVVAVLEKRKGHPILIQAISELNSDPSMKAVPYVFIEGQGPQERDLRELVERLGVGHRVKFIEHEANIFNFLQAIDILALPSISNEDFPNVILEAMSVGKPAIASKLAGTPEQIDDGRTGWLVEPGDVGTLKLTLAAISQNREVLSCAGDAAKSRFNRMFTADAAVSRYLDLYEILLKARREN